MPRDFFLREREGLTALSGAGSSLLFPKVLELSQSKTGGALVLELLESSPPAPAAWEALGRGLAELHRRTETRFGFPTDNYIGLTPQENGWMGNWGDFFAERRIAPLVNRLERAGALSAPEAKMYARLLEKIPALLAHAPPASLLHGDLWIGNFLATPQGPALIDPAVYYGDRETEWAMMNLFGGFSEAAFAAYQEDWPLPGDWRERQPLYQLYHLLNHQLLFGGGYGAQALTAARQYLP